MASNRDYYEILGVDKKATAEEIKKAYRKLAREHHPDMVSETDKQAAEIRFKEINEAYQVLSDPEKRSMYDQFGKTGPGFNSSTGGNPFGSSGNWGPFSYTSNSDFDPFDIFEDFFGFRGFSNRSSPKRGKNLYYELHIEFKESVLGIEKTINIESGKVQVKIPAGVHDGTEIRFGGKGMPGPNGAPSGDLFLTIRTRMPKEFRRVGNNLFTVVQIDMVQAALGDVVEIPVVDPKDKNGVGKTKIKIPSGTQPNTQIRVRGKGLPIINTSSFGDIIFQVIVNIPTRLSKKQKQLLQNYLNG